MSTQGLDKILATCGLPTACEVCYAEPAASAVCVPGVPVSMAYGRECLKVNAHPYGILVANTACCGGCEHTASWWHGMVTDTLDHLGIPHEVFYRDVADCMKQEAGGRMLQPDDTQPLFTPLADS